MTVGERIREARIKLGMSQVDFADKINVSKQTLYKYENNIITNIPSDKIEAAAELCNISPAYLMGWEIEVVSCDENKNRLEKRLLAYFDTLSDIGKKKALDNLEDLSKIYSLGHILPDAANQRTDIDIPEGTDTSDNDIMDNENF